MATFLSCQLRQTLLLTSLGRAARSGVFSRGTSLCCGLDATRWKEVRTFSLCWSMSRRRFVAARMSMEHPCPPRTNAHSSPFHVLSSARSCRLLNTQNVRTRRVTGYAYFKDIARGRLSGGDAAGFLKLVARADEPSRHVVVGVQIIGG